MPRARKKTEVRTDAAMTETPDVFDEAIDARQEPFTAVLDQPARAGGDLADRAAPRCIANPSGTRREPPPGELHERSRRRDSAIMTDAVAGTRLYSNHATHAMAIIFEDKPSEAVRGMLKEAGFRWRPEEKAWEKPQSGYESRIRDRMQAERVFLEIAGLVCAEKGAVQAR